MLAKIFGSFGLHAICVTMSLCVAYSDSHLCKLPRETVGCMQAIAQRVRVVDTGLFSRKRTR